jgi:UrcA family protein
MKRLTICALALAMMAPAASFAAPADNGGAVATIKVAYSDLDLGNPKDAALLLRRIDSAATEACGRWTTYNPIDIQLFQLSACRQEAVRNAVDRIGAPALSALFDRRTEVAANGG